MTTYQFGESNSTLRKFSWTNAAVAALGGVTSGTLDAFTLQAGEVVQKALIVITGQAGTLTVCTVSMGVTTALYIDYIIALNAKAAANTVYGTTFSNLGTGLSALVGSLPSVTTTTTVKLRFDATAENLSGITGSTGNAYIWTTTLT